MRRNNMYIYEVTLVAYGDEKLPYVITTCIDKDDPEVAIESTKRHVATIGYFPEHMSIEDRMNILTAISVKPLLGNYASADNRSNELKRFLDAHGGVENFRCFAKMPKCDRIPGLGLAITNDDNITWTECKIDESRYKIEDAYKIRLRSIDERFAYEDYYVSDFFSLITEDLIIIKTNDNQKVKHIIVEEPLCGIATIVHEFDVVE
jgi:hypothetical protein